MALPLVPHSNVASLAHSRHRPWRLGALLLGVTACWGGKPAAPAPDLYERQGTKVLVPESSPLRSRIQVAPATEQDIQSQLLATASVESDPARLARISPPLAGHVEKLLVHLGDRVEKGQPLFLLSSPDLAQAQADYVRAKSGLSQAQKTYARQKDLTEHGIGAQRELEQAEADRTVAQSELERARKRLEQLGVSVDAPPGPLVVRSPIAGRVVDLAVTGGEFKNDPNAVLMTVADLSTVWLTASVQEKDVRKVKVGDEAAAVFSAYPDERFVGKVFSVADLLDLDTRTVKVRVSVDNPEGRFKPGMFATVRFSGTSIPRVVVPSTALVLRGDESFAYVEVAPWVFEPRRVVTGQQQGDVTVITEGLDAGTRVVTTSAVVLQ
ncbi:MAG: efflux RND transporter periplasmic adaptor subunit [Myxococcaceae bacterium]